MLKPRKKLTKKEIKEDKFVETAMMTRAFLYDNYKTVLSITSAIFGALVLIIAYTYFHGQAEKTSASLLGQAQLEYHNMNYSTAKQHLNRLFDEYTTTDALYQGKFLMANLLFQENKITEAKQYFDDFIDSYNGSEILLSSAYAGYAACLERENKYEDAAENYEKAWKTAPAFVEAANYLYLAGRNYHKSTKLDAAKTAFETIVKQYEKSSRKRDAEAQLILIAGK
jgi:outer membrane protein assembly factor BamD (BamD/ComL family)